MLTATRPSLNEGLKRTIFLRRYSEPFPEGAVKKAAVAIADRFHDGICGECGVGEQIRCLLKLLLLQELLERVAGIFFQQTADVIGRKLQFGGYVGERPAFIMRFNIFENTENHILFIISRAVL